MFLLSCFFGLFEFTYLEPLTFYFPWRYNASPVYIATHVCFVLPQASIVCMRPLELWGSIWNPAPQDTQEPIIWLNTNSELSKHWILLTLAYLPLEFPEPLPTLQVSLLFGFDQPHEILASMITFDLTITILATYRWWGSQGFDRKQGSPVL